MSDVLDSLRALLDERIAAEMTLVLNEAWRDTFNPEAGDYVVLYEDAVVFYREDGAFLMMMNREDYDALYKVEP